MLDFEKIIENCNPLEVTVNFFVLYRDEETWLDGWISMEHFLEEFKNLVQEEIEYSLGLENSHMKDYEIFHINTENKNNMKQIKNNDYYLWVRGIKEIFIVVLHRDIKYYIIENVPILYEWFMETL
jgi:hypothetical protein